MFQKKASISLRSVSTPQQTPNPVQHRTPALSTLFLLPPGGGAIAQQQPSALVEFVAAAAPRCSSFCAEAAVLVLVLALLDRFMVKNRLELNWALSAAAISVALLAASVLTDFVSRRWLRRH